MIKKLVIGSILSVIILMIVPSIPAVEIHTVEESKKAQIGEQIQNIKAKFPSFDTAHINETVIADIISDIQSKVSTNEQMQLHQSFIKSLGALHDIFLMITTIIYIIFSLFIFWLVQLPYWLINGFYIPFWLYLFEMIFPFP